MVMKYIVVGHNGKHAIFNVDINDSTDDSIRCFYKIGACQLANKEDILRNNPISQWWDDIGVSGLVREESDYYIVEQDNKRAIFHRDNPYTPISQWWDEISKEGVVTGESDFYRASKYFNSKLKHAIFHVSDPINPISQWWDYIEVVYGIVGGDSNYYMVRQDKYNAIFHVSDPINPISQWGDMISEDGPVKGTSNYYILRRQQDREKYISAIFHKNNPYVPVSKWWDRIYLDGVVVGETDYYLVEHNGKSAIFHIDDPENPITGWKSFLRRSTMKKFLVRERKHNDNNFDLFDIEIV